MSSPHLQQQSQGKLKSKDINLLNSAAYTDENEHFESSSSSSSLLSNGSSFSANDQASKKFEISPSFLLLIKDEDPFHERNGFGADDASSFDSNDVNGAAEEDENKNLLMRKQQEQQEQQQQQQQEQTTLNGHNSAIYDDNENSLSTSVNTNNSDVPILTNTTLNVIRLFGKYIHMLSIFKIISNQVITYLMQLFQFYFYFIYLDFTQQDVMPL